MASDPISRFATVHFADDRLTDRPTHTQTDIWDRRQIYTISTYARYMIESDALIIIYARR